MNNCTVLIMAGGSGERFWPLSTKERPKQLLKLVDPQKSLIQMTVERVLPIVPVERIFIATNSVQAPAVMEELPNIPAENIIIEPAFKDTAAAIGFASVIVGREYPGSVMIVLASDHLIKHEDNFRESLKTAIDAAANENAIVTLGIKPAYPETGYGYLETESIHAGEVGKVLRFCEKPLYNIAEEYVKGGRHLWNSGMFIFKIDVMMDAFKRVLPDHYNLLMQIDELGSSMRDPGNEALNLLFSNFTKISVDYGIMEKFHNTLVIPVEFGWSDIGSFPALAEVFEADKNNNIVKGTEARSLNSGGNIVISTTSKRVSLLGVNNMVIVETPDEILICSKEEAQNIKKII